MSDNKDKKPKLISDVPKNTKITNEDLKLMSMIYKILNSIIVSIETCRFEKIHTKDLDNYKNEIPTIIRISTIKEK